jgi:hypothetical protein
VLNFRNARIRKFTQCGTCLQGLGDQPFEMKRPLERRGSGRNIPALRFDFCWFAQGFLLLKRIIFFSIR